jgi:hypothetical protein
VPPEKGEEDLAVHYFKTVVSSFASQTAVADKGRRTAQQAGTGRKGFRFAQIDGQVIQFLGETFAKIALDADQKHLPVNSHVNYVDVEGYLYGGGINAYYNWTGRTITQKVRSPE